MDDAHFDALVRSFSAGHSRRGLSRLVGGLVLAGPLAFLLELEAEGKRKKGKKKKKKKPSGPIVSPSQPAPPPTVPPPPPLDRCPGQKLCGGGCIPTNQCCTDADCPAGQHCCNGDCIPTDQCCTGQDCAAGLVCCDGECNGPVRGFCTFHSDCCSGYCRSRDCSATCLGKPCTPAEGCCGGFTCLSIDSMGSNTCGGCKNSSALCQSDAECCFSNCTARPDGTERRCWSFPGGPCEKAADCRSCFSGECVVTINGTIRSICVNGICACPDDDECCPNKPCAPAERCVTDAIGLNGVCVRNDLP
jgi:hypothetical protein